MDLVQMSVQAGVLIAAIVIVRTITLYRLPKASFLALWGIVIARLLIPFSLTSKWSIYNLFGGLLKHEDAPASAEGFAAAWRGQGLLSPEAVTGPAAAMPAISPLTALWIGGVAVLAAVFAVLLVRNYRALRTAVPMEDHAVITKWREEYRLLRPLAVVRSDKVDSPASIGILRPQIIFPQKIELDIAKHTDLLGLLPSLGYTLKRIGSYYTTAEMDNIRIRDPTRWKRYSTRQGGDAITFLQEFCGMRFLKAVDYLLAYHGRSRDSPDRNKPIPRPKPPPPREKPPFVLPPANPDQRRVFAYLRKRCVSSQVIRAFLDAGLLYEDAQYHNCVFVGNVETLFDYRQIWLAVISKEGWEFLIQQYGYKRLFEINIKSGWIDCEELDEFIEALEYEIEISPDTLK